MKLSHSKVKIDFTKKFLIQNVKVDFRNQLQINQYFNKTFYAMIKENKAS